MESDIRRGEGRTGSLSTNTTSPKRLEPGQGPGILRMGDFTGTFGLTLALELNGTTRGSGYDSLDLTGSIISPALTRLELSVGYAAAPGDSFIILNNTGTGPVNGSFFGSSFVPLSEGRFLDAPGGHYFRISYTGGDSNDVTLTKVMPPPVRITGFSAVPGTGTITGFSVVSITAAASAGLTYRLESSTDLAGWSLLTTFPADTAGVITADFTEPAHARRFYRFTLP